MIPTTTIISIRVKPRSAWLARQRAPACFSIASMLLYRASARARGATCLAVGEVQVRAGLDERLQRLDVARPAVAEDDRLGDAVQPRLLM